MRRDVELSRGFASSDLSRHDDSLLGFRRRLGSSALSTGSNCGDLQDSQSSLDKKSAGDQHSLPSVSRTNLSCGLFSIFFFKSERLTESPKPGLTASSSKAAVAPSPPNEPCVSGMRQSQPRSGREVSMSRNGPGGVGVSQLRNSYDEAMLMESMQQSYANSRRNELASQPDYFALNNPFVLAQMESAAAAGMFFDPVYQQHQQLMMAAAQQAHMQQEHMR